MSFNLCSEWRVGIRKRVRSGDAQSHVKVTVRGESPVGSLDFQGDRWKPECKA